MMHGVASTGSTVHAHTTSVALAPNDLPPIRAGDPSRAVGATAERPA